MKRKLSNIGTFLHQQAKDHFIPHRGNDHVPHVLQHRALFGYGVLMVLLKVLVITASVTYPAALVYSSAITPGNIIALTNQTRVNAGLETLSQNSLLASAAQAKASDMLSNQYFAHTSPAGATPWSWILGSGYTYQYAGENLAVHYSSAEGVHSGWMASPSHRGNILDSRFTEVGVGIVQGEFEDYYTTFVVQMFGHRAGFEAPIEETVEDQEPATEQPEEEEPAPEVETPAEPAEEEPITPEEPEIAPEATEETQNDPEAPIVASADENAPQEPTLLEPEIDQSTVEIIPSKDGYSVEVVVANAETVSAELGEDEIPLQQKDGNVWTAHLSPSDELLAKGDQLFITATSEDGEQVSESLAWIGPSATIQEVFAFNQAPEQKILGLFSVRDLEQRVQWIYVGILVFLGISLTLAISIHYHEQRYKMIAHCLAIVLLGAALIVL